MERPHQSRTKLIRAAQTMIRRKGYAATTVDDICQQAEVTKGSFFHHFKGKEELVLSAIADWNDFTGEIFATADYAHLEDPRARVLGYIDFRIKIVDLPVSEFTCLLGTLVQEVYETSPALREAAEGGMSGHVAMLMHDIEAARLRNAPDANWTSESVGYFIQSVLQGAFIFAKARGDADVVRASLAHLKHYLELLLPIRH
jgi:TetR/AcrR family transcriptional regulator, transcriptional repressor for nem operon